MGSLLGVSFGALAYAAFVGAFVYAVGFIGNIGVPKSIDAGGGGSLASSLLVDLLLLAIFAAQHSIMARKSFKAWWTRFVPAHVERSSYVLAASAALGLLCWQWRPISEPVIWEVRGAAATVLLQAMFWMGWVLLLVASFLINHFELFGLRQVLARFRGRTLPAAEFRTPFIYRYVRHPIYLGFILGFWSTPVMTAGHLLFAIGGTGYILLGIWFEERDLMAQFGEQYRAYRRRVGMLFPLRREQ